MILLVNGPNLNLLGEREPEVYGRETLADVERMVTQACAGYGVEVKALQSNWEGALLDFLQQHRNEAQGVILNPGALTHTSRALADCLRSLRCPTIEVHISNIHARESWRRESFTAPATRGQIVGLGTSGYYYAALHLCALLSAEAAAKDDRSTASRSAPGGEQLGSRGSMRGEPIRSKGDQRRAVNDQLGAAAENGEQGDSIPVDVNARGDYEPL